MHTHVFSVYFDGFSQLDISTDREAITQNKSWDIFTMSVGFSFPPFADFFHTFKTSGFQDTYATYLLLLRWTGQLLDMK